MGQAMTCPKCGSDKVSGVPNGVHCKTCGYRGPKPSPTSLEEGEPGAKPPLENEREGKE
jgi:ribosomal protein L37AE/L43A